VKTTSERLAWWGVLQSTRAGKWNYPSGCSVVTDPEHVQWRVWGIILQHWQHHVS